MVATRRDCASLALYDSGSVAVTLITEIIRDGLLNGSSNGNNEEIELDPYVSSTSFYIFGF